MFCSPGRVNRLKYDAEITARVYNLPVKTKTEVRILVGPAGSGKTFCCVNEIGETLQISSCGPSLILIAPRQSTFQLERQILQTAGLAGYTRLRILSFERLAESILTSCNAAPARVLSEEGQVMVLRALLHQHAGAFKVFRGTARLPGFAREVALSMRELQQHGMSLDKLRAVAARVEKEHQLRSKIDDMLILLEAYLSWLDQHGLHDTGSLLDLATELLRKSVCEPGLHDGINLRFGGVWLDGFAELTPQEIEILAALVPHCERITLAFCCETGDVGSATWHSAWTVVGRTVRSVQRRLSQLPGVAVTLEILPRQPGTGRFSGSPALARLERCWNSISTGGEGTGCSAATLKPVLNGQARNRAASKAASKTASIQRAGQVSGSSSAGHISFENRETDSPEPAIAVFRCANPVAEAVLAAREILRHVRDHGARFRDTAVLVRSLATHADIVRRVFVRYDIPFFLDWREPVSHHPLAELTRAALRTVAFGWQQDDWLNVLKTGLVGADDEALDRLENYALAHGWDRDHWLAKPTASDQADHGQLESLRSRIVEPFVRLGQVCWAAENKVPGELLARALRQLWSDLDVADRLATWSKEDTPVRPGSTAPPQVHHAVWEQMNDLLSNLALAFGETALDLREWPAVLDAGLSNLTVGIIPPALDQVLVGAVDRSRNPDLALVVVLGMNASVFPATPTRSGILSDADRAVLARAGFELVADERTFIAREKYYAYIACTRPKERLVLTFAESDADGRPLNPSPFVGLLKRIFPALTLQRHPQPHDCIECMHPSELIPEIVSLASRLPRNLLFVLPSASPGITHIAEELIATAGDAESEKLNPVTAEMLYGPGRLRCSVSRLEQFAACPFQFFVSAGLRAEERELFELDAKRIGVFSHEVLAEFHRRLQGDGLRWREIDPAQARSIVCRIASELAQSFGHGLFRSAQDRQLTARALAIALEDFVEQIVTWMRAGYEFDPLAVETDFGGAGTPLPAWEIQLDGQHVLALHGKIDRIDICRETGAQELMCVVVDYKSSATNLQEKLLTAGLQLQLPAYLAAVTHLAAGRLDASGRRWVPAGMFYAPIRGSAPAAANRSEASAEPEKVRSEAHVHRGRFRADALPRLDRLHDQETPSGQFQISRRKQSQRKYTDVREADEFLALLAAVENTLRDFGRRIFKGDVAVDPFAISSSRVACDQCDYAPICRINPWTHSFRGLDPGPGASQNEPE